MGHGETVTVRVPTHDEGTALFWEFSTDSYDIAFGLFFEWNKAPEETEVSVHVSDSEDEDLDEEYLGGCWVRDRVYPPSRRHWISIFKDMIPQTIYEYRILYTFILNIMEGS